MLNFSLMGANEVAANIAILRKLRRLVEMTTDALAPADPSKLDDEEIAQRRWQIHLGVLMTDVARSFEKLAKGNEIRGCIILSRCMYEYRIRSAYLLKHRERALAVFQTARKRHYWDLQRLPPLDDAREAEMAHDYLDWYKTADLTDENMGLPGVVDMAVDLAEPGEVRVDPNKRKYVHDEGTSYTLPSWYVHGGPQLIIELFDDWTDPLNWRYYKEVQSLSLTAALQAALEHAAAYLIVLRPAFGLDVAPAKKLFHEAWVLNGFDKLHRRL